VGLIFSLFLHDKGDVFLEFGKLFLYLKKKIYNVCYFLLLPSWFLLRCISFPLTILNCTYHHFFQDFIGKLMFFQEAVIWVMGCIWFLMILKILSKAIKGKIEKDIRSVSEEEGEKIPK